MKNMGILVITCIEFKSRTLKANPRFNGQGFENDDKYGDSMWLCAGIIKQKVPIFYFSHYFKLEIIF